MKNLILIFALLASSLINAQECDTNPEGVKNYIGQEVTVCGVISQVYSPKGVKGEPTFLNMGGEFPNHIFTVVIWNKVAKTFKIDLADLKNKKVRITGYIEEYDGIPQIVLRYKEQITRYY